MKLMLCDIRPGIRAVVTEIPDTSALKGRLQEFGMMPGPQIKCLFLSPGGDLAALELKGTVIAVRVADLTGITARRCQ